MLLVATARPFVPWRVSVFLLGMGIVNPLGTAQALSRSAKGGRGVRARVGFWQMMTAAIGVWLAATISRRYLRWAPC
jgi:DHA1 family bicyclomycin/chloramphenicol resistance-like MFS transporter